MLKKIKHEQYTITSRRNVLLNKKDIFLNKEELIKAL